MTDELTKVWQPKDYLRKAIFSSYWTTTRHHPLGGETLRVLVMGAVYWGLTSYELSMLSVNGEVMKKYTETTQHSHKGGDPMVVFPSVATRDQECSPGGYFHIEQIVDGCLNLTRMVHMSRFKREFNKYLRNAKYNQRVIIYRNNKPACEFIHCEKDGTVQVPDIKLLYFTEDRSIASVGDGSVSVTPLSECHKLAKSTFEQLSRWKLTSKKVDN